MQPANNLCPSLKKLNVNKECASCDLCFSATETQLRQNLKQQDSMHLYAAERKLYQFYYNEVMQRSGNQIDAL
jgi:hypothetical protein